MWCFSRHVAGPVGNTNIQWGCGRSSDSHRSSAHCPSLIRGCAVTALRAPGPLQGWSDGLPHSQHLSFPEGTQGVQGGGHELHIVLARGFQQLSSLGTLLVLQPEHAWNPRGWEEMVATCGLLQKPGKLVWPVCAPTCPQKLHATIRADKVASSSLKFLYLQKGKKPWSNSTGLILWCLSRDIIPFPQKKTGSLLPDISTSANAFLRRAGAYCPFFSSHIRCIGLGPVPYLIHYRCRLIQRKIRTAILNI